MDTETTTPAMKLIPRLARLDGALRFVLHEESMNSVEMTLNQVENMAYRINTAVNSHDSNVKRIAELEALLKEFAVHKNDDCVITRICRCGYDQKILTRFK